MENLYQGRSYMVRLGASSSHTADEFETALYLALRAREEAGFPQCGDYRAEIAARSTMSAMEIDGKSWAETVRIERSFIVQCATAADVPAVRRFRREQARALAGVR